MTGYIVNVLIVNNDKVLFLQRSSKDAYRPSTWGFPGGNADKNESIENAAIRETFEETGIVLKEIRPINSYVYQGEKETCVKVTFLAKVSISDVKLSDEHVGFEWRDINGIFEPRFQEQIDIAKKLL